MSLSDIYTGYMEDPSFDDLRRGGTGMTSRHFVPGVGMLGTIMFIGEAPGEEEDRLREPFVGKSGERLSEMLDGIGIDRDHVFITNIVKYRPFANRDPYPSELLNSLSYMSEEVTAVNPYLIVLLGRVATKAFYPGKAFKDLKGRLFHRRGRQILVTYHPAATLYNRDKLPEYQEHFGRIREVVDAHGGLEP